MPSVPASRYDIFVSYFRKDNQHGRITALKDWIAVQYHQKVSGLSFAFSLAKDYHLNDV